MNDAAVRFRRRRFFLVRVADEPALDMHAFFRGDVVLRGNARCVLLCPVRGESLPLTAAELDFTMKFPVDRWLAETALDGATQDARARALDLARRGILLSDPAFDDWTDVVSGEQALEAMQWHDVAAVFHAHTRWQGVPKSIAAVRIDNAEELTPFERIRRHHGEPPPHFVRRHDALERAPLRVPVLDGPFFEVLLARRTTRAFRSQQSLPLPLLEVLLYAVFGTHGIKHEQGISGIKRTSPSGGALHPIEAYLLVMNVEGLAAGLYHYESGGHALALLERMDGTMARALACEFTAGQKYFAEAHVLVIHVARFHRNFWKYAQHRKAYKAVLMDSAHLSQTFYLTAAHLGLGAFFTAAINDADVDQRLQLKPLHEAAIAINGAGLPDSTRNGLHFVPDAYWPTGTTDAGPL